MSEAKDGSLKNDDEIVLTEENAAEIARKEFEADNKPDAELEKPPADGEDTTPSSDEAPEESPEKKVKTDEEILEAKEEELSVEDKEKRKALLKAAEDAEKELLEKPESELKPEEKEKKEAIIAKKEAEEAEKFNEQVKVYAETKKITTDDARKLLESNAKIQAKYGKDAFKLAEAYLESQHLIARKDDEIKAIKEQANRPRQPQTVAEWEGVLKERGIVLQGGKVVPWSDGVSLYREENPDDTDGLTDEQVLRTIARDINTRFEVHREKEEGKKAKLANEKRASLINSIPEHDKQFSEEITELLNSVPNSAILDGSYDLEPALRWARGGFYTKEKVDALIKEAEIKGFNRGKISSNSKIVSGPAGTGKPAAKSNSIILSPSQKDEAWRMFPDSKDDKEAFENYQEIMKEKKEK